MEHGTRELEWRHRGGGVALRQVATGGKKKKDGGEEQVATGGQKRMGGGQRPSTGTGEDMEEAMLQGEERAGGGGTSAI
jgi:hypothetical protein